MAIKAVIIGMIFFRNFLYFCDLFFNLSKLLTIAKTNVNIFIRVLDFDAFLQLLEIEMHYQKINMYHT